MYFKMYFSNAVHSFPIQKPLKAPGSPYWHIMDKTDQKISKHN